MTVDTPPPSGNIGLTPAQCAALDADRADGSDRVALVAVHPGEPDLDALTQALMELRRRHDVLRTTVRYTDDGPVGTVGTRTVVPVELMAERPPHLADGFPPKRFDLANGPLMHVALSSDDGGRTLLGFQAHPVALDEETMRRAVHELGLLYRYFASDGPIPPVTRVGYREHAAGVGSTTGRVPRRMPVVSHEIGPATADRVRLIASSRGLPVALLVLAAWITAGAATSGAAAAPVATSPWDPAGRRPLGPTCDRILLRADAGSACDIVALAEHLDAATGDAEPDDGGTRAPCSLPPRSPSRPSARLRRAGSCASRTVRTSRAARLAAPPSRARRRCWRRRAPHWLTRSFYESHRSVPHRIPDDKGR